VCFRLRHLCAGSSRHPAESRSSSCGPRFRFRLLPTPPHGDAVTFRYGGVASSGMDLHHADLTPLWTHTKRPAGGLPGGLLVPISTAHSLCKCLNLNEKKCKFLLCCRYCQAPFTHFFLLSILPSKAYPIGNTFIAQMFISAHMSTNCGLPGAAKVRYDPCHHPGLNTRCFRSHGLV